MAVTDAGEPGGESDDPAGSAPVSVSKELVRRSADAIESSTPMRKSVSARDTVRAATGVAKVAFGAATGVTAWTIDTALGVTATVVRGSIAGAPPREVLAEAESEVRGAVRRALGLSTAAGELDPADIPTLREQGAALLRMSAGTHSEDQHHPAFARILADLTPDEARILRFLRLDGPQPALDIRTGRPRGLGGERLVQGLNLIGEHAGLRFPNRIQQYLTNLHRLGLVAFAKEPVVNPARYQVLEAQAPVREALRRSLFGTRVTYRSIMLTGFGTDFVHACLPIVVSDGTIADTQ